MESLFGMLLFLGLPVLLIVAALNDHAKRKAREAWVDNLGHRVAELEREVHRLRVHETARDAEHRLSAPPLHAQPTGAAPGSPAASPTGSVLRTCPNCRRFCAETAEFCRFCGNRVSEVVPSQPGVPPGPGHESAPSGVWPTVTPSHPGIVLSQPASGAGHPGFAPPPSPPVPVAPPVPYTDKASRGEMAFAGYYLNIAGIIFVTIGVVLFLRASVSGAQAALAGVVPTMAGLAGGLGLIFAGDRLWHRNLQQYAHALIAGGFGVLLLTNCAAHFYFNLIDSRTLFLSMAALVAWSGLSVFRYDSRLIGNFVLGVLYAGPFLLSLSMDRVAIMIMYLVAIHVGTAFVAYYKKWDYFLVVSFLGSYALYFHHFGMRQPGPTLLFTTIVYALFLVSNNLLHFTRRSASGYSLALSFVNPSAYAAVSYHVLLVMPNALAMTLYLALAVVHLGMAVVARRNAERDPLFVDIGTNNLVLGILFLTAAVSFVTYFSTETSCFSAVMGLWLLEAFVLLELSFRTEPHDAARLILRRYAWFCLALAGFQLFYVVSTVAVPAVMVWNEQLWATLGCAGAYAACFAWTAQRRNLLGSEDIVALRAVALAAVVFTALALPADTQSLFQQVGAMALAFVMLVASFRYAEVLGFFRMLAAALASLVVLAVLGDSPDAGPARMVAYSLMAVLLATAARTLRLHRPDLPAGEQQAPILATSLALSVLGKGAVCLATGPPSTLAWALLGLLVLEAAHRDESLDYGTLWRSVFFLTFLKSITFDANFVYAQKGLRIAAVQSMTVTDFAAVVGLLLVMAAAARRAGKSFEQRNFFFLLGLMIFAFQSTCVLYNFLGVLDSFQIILSAFWCTSAFAFVAAGVFRESKVFRLFGLVLLVAAVAKICVVDIWVLGAYSQVTTFLIMGGLLMMVSLLYQASRARLLQAGTLEEGRRDEGTSSISPREVTTPTPADDIPRATPVGSAPQALPADEAARTLPAVGAAVATPAPGGETQALPADDAAATTPAADPSQALGGDATPPAADPSQALGGDATPPAAAPSQALGEDATPPASDPSQALGGDPAPPASDPSQALGGDATPPASVPSQAPGGNAAPPAADPQPPSR